MAGSLAAEMASFNVASANAAARLGSCQSIRGARVQGMQNGCKVAMTATVARPSASTDAKKHKMVTNQRAHTISPEKLELVQSLEGWAEETLLPLLKPVESAWQPSDFLPSSEKESFIDEVKELRERAKELPDEYFVSLVGDMITEEALPTYQTMLNTLDGTRDETGASPTPWGIWTRQWTAEENRHGDLLNRYLYLTGRVNMRAVETTIQYLIGSGMDPKTENNPYLGFLYTSFQERATAISHGNTARHAVFKGEKNLGRICGLIAADEKRHERAYQAIVGKLYELDPNGAMLAFEDMMKKQIVMPAHLMYDGENEKLFDAFTMVAQRTGVYTANDYVSIIEHLIARWNVEKIEGLDADGRRAQEYVCKLPPRIRKLAERSADKLKKAGPKTGKFSWVFNREVVLVERRFQGLSDADFQPLDSCTISPSPDGSRLNDSYDGSSLPRPSGGASPVSAVATGAAAAATVVRWRVLCRAWPAHWQQLRSIWLSCAWGEMLPHWCTHGRNGGGSGAFRRASTSPMPGCSASFRASPASDDEDSPDGFDSLDSSYWMPFSFPHTLPGSRTHPILFIASNPLPPAPSKPPFLPHSFLLPSPHFLPNLYASTRITHITRITRMKSQWTRHSHEVFQETDVRGSGVDDWRKGESEGVQVGQEQCGRGSVSREEAERLERVWSFIRHHPASLPLMPRLLSLRLPPDLRPPTSPSHPTSPTMVVQASNGRYCSSSSNSSSINGSGGTVLDRRLVMLLVRRLKERQRHQHALELLQWHMARPPSHGSPHSPHEHEHEQGSQSSHRGVEREDPEWEACELIDGLARCGRWRDARDAFLALPRHARSHKAYSGVLYHLARTGQHSQLQEELQWLHETAGAALGVSSFNARLLALSTLPSRLASADSVTQRMDGIMEEMKAKGITPSLFTFHILLRHCLHHPPHAPTSSPDRLDALLHAMHHHHLLPSAQTHSILLRVFLHTGQLARAEKSFHAMLGDGLAPSSTACAVLWMAMGRAGKGGRGGEVEGMWRRVGGMGVRVTRPMHVARIAAHVAAGDIAMAEEAFSSLHACIRRLDRDACNALLKGYTRANMPDAALRLVDDMQRANISCGTATLSLLLSCLSRSQRLSHATALLTQLVTPVDTHVTLDPRATTKPLSSPFHPESLDGSVRQRMPPPATPCHALPSYSPRHHGSHPSTPPAAIKRRTLRGLMEALKAEGHVEGVRQAIQAGEAMWGTGEVAWYKMLIGAMLRRAEVLAGKGEGGDGEGSSGGRWEEAARGVEEEMRVKGVRADHEILLCFNPFSASPPSLLQPLLCFNPFSASTPSLLQPLLCFNPFSASTPSLLQPLLCFIPFSASTPSLLHPLLCFNPFSASPPSLLQPLLCFTPFSASTPSLLQPLLCFTPFSASTPSLLHPLLCFNPFSASPPSLLQPLLCFNHSLLLPLLCFSPFSATPFFLHPISATPQLCFTPSPSHHLYVTNSIFLSFPGSPLSLLHNLSASPSFYFFFFVWEEKNPSRQLPLDGFADGPRPSKQGTAVHSAKNLRRTPPAYLLHPFSAAPPLLCCSTPSLLLHPFSAAPPLLPLKTFLGNGP
ncbi:unnamed protein product [Closterium sp. Naga37s-1]|nr:unnamed protein product [Closterium sp. Naga37s-1]